MLLSGHKQTDQMSQGAVRFGLQICQSVSDSVTVSVSVHVTVSVTANNSYTTWHMPHAFTSKCDTLSQQQHRRKKKQPTKVEPR